MHEVGLQVPNSTDGAPGWCYSRTIPPAPSRQGPALPPSPCSRGNEVVVDLILANITVERVEVNHVDLVTSCGKRLREVVGGADAGEIHPRVGIHQVRIVVQERIAQLHDESVTWSSAPLDTAAPGHSEPPDGVGREQHES